MSAAAEFLLLVVMLVGAMGTIVPLLPGLPLIGIAGVVWAVADGGGPARWGVVAVMLATMAVGMAATYALPGRAVGEAGVPRAAVALAVVAGVVGFFVVPVVGLPVGAAAGLYLGVLLDRRDPAASWQVTWAAIRAFGLGVLVSFAAALLMIAVWLVGLAIT